MRKIYCGGLELNKMRMCKCGHPKKSHVGVNGECCHTDENAKWDCKCFKFVDNVNRRKK